MLTAIIQKAGFYVNGAAQRFLSLRSRNRETPDKKLEFYLEGASYELGLGNFRCAASYLDSAREVALEGKLALPPKYDSLRINTGRLGFDASLERAQQITKESKDRPSGSRLGASQEVDLLTAMETSGLSGVYATALTYLDKAREYAGMANIEIPPQFTMLEQQLNQVSLKFRVGLAMHRLAQMDSSDAKGAYSLCDSALTDLRAAKDHAAKVQIAWPANLLSLERRLEEIAATGSSQQPEGRTNSLLLNLQMDTPLYTR